MVVWEFDTGPRGYGRDVGGKAVLRAEQPLYLGSDIGNAAATKPSRTRTMG
jgi:hypothetical protein